MATHKIYIKISKFQGHQGQILPNPFIGLHSTGITLNEWDIFYWQLHTSSGLWSFLSYLHKCCSAPGWLSVHSCRVSVNHSPLAYLPSPISAGRCLNKQLPFVILNSLKKLSRFWPVLDPAPKCGYLLSFAPDLLILIVDEKLHEEHLTVLSPTEIICFAFMHSPKSSLNLLIIFWFLWVKTMLYWAFSIWQMANAFFSYFYPQKQSYNQENWQVLMLCGKLIQASIIVMHSSQILKSDPPVLILNCFQDVTILRFFLCSTSCLKRCLSKHH